MEISCIVLAGGEAKRLQNKPFVLLNKKPLIFHVLEKVEKIFDDIVVVVKNEEQKSRIKNFNVVLDKEPVFSPVAGIKEGIEHIKNDYFFLTACDMPFIDIKIINEMIDKIGNYDCMILKSKNRYEPFFAIYKKSVFDSCKLEDGLQRIIRKSNKLEIEANDSNVFFNINTKKDLEKAENLI